MRLVIALLFALGATPAAADSLSVDLRAFGGCTAVRASKLGQQLLASEPGSSAERGMLDRIYDRIGTCLTYDAMHAPVTRLRGAVAEGLIATSLGGAAMRQPTVQPIFARDASVSGSRQRTNAEIYGFGQCVVAAQPIAVRSLLDTAVDTPAERLAVQALRPTLAPCLSNASALRLDRPTLRAVLAESLYTLTGGAR